MAAKEDIDSPTMRKRGGQGKWKMSSQHRYNRDLHHQKQRKQRRQATNRQIWQRLQALAPKVEEMVTLLMQLTNIVEERTRSHRPGEELLEQAMAGQHWVAIGDAAQEQKMNNAGRKVSDGILFCVAISMAGR